MRPATVRGRRRGMVRSTFEPGLRLRSQACIRSENAERQPENVSNGVRLARRPCRKIDLFGIVLRNAFNTLRFRTASGSGPYVEESFSRRRLETKNDSLMMQLLKTFLRS